MTAMIPTPAVWLLLHLTLSAAPLPRPEPRLPANPPLPPMVITSGGQRVLLSAVTVHLRYDAALGQLVSSQPGWWIINYPLDRIEGLPGRSRDELARIILGRPADQVVNWFQHTPGKSPDEPDEPTGPAPIVPTGGPAIYVSDRGDDAGDGSAERPLRHLGTAVKRAAPGTLIRVKPGVYRESVTVTRSGTAAQPVRLEGVPDDAGALPVISGNDLFGSNAWKPVMGVGGVWRAELFTNTEGTVSAAGRTLVERSLPGELKRGEFCCNRGSREYARPSFNGELDGAPGGATDGHAWQRIVADEQGFLDLGAPFGERARRAVIWASTWVWVPPLKRQNVVWDPRYPQPVTGQVDCAGEFRAARMGGSNLSAQVNPYRVWVNGERLPAVVYSRQEAMELDRPHPHRQYGFTDRWENFTLREGWNHLVFQFDTTCRPDKLKFRFGAPRGLPPLTCSATKPAALDRATGPGTAWLSELMVLAPYPATPDRAVYVHLPDGGDPNRVAVDLGARGTLLSVQADHVQVRGLEFRHGAQFQQRAQVDLSGEGLLLEGCRLRDSEVRGVTFVATKDQRAAPIVIRGNWIENPGNVGIGGQGLSEKLTAANQSVEAPGRSPVLIEYNTIVNNNWTGTEPFWESGGMKMFRLTGAIIRYNTIVGGSGPGIWLDWEHYNNRIEGNLFRDAWAFGVGIEASPGPNLVANNVTINLRPGAVWFRYGVLSWSSDRNLVVNNTIDGRWNQLPAWQQLRGADGIFLNEGGDDRGTVWGALTGRVQTMLDNLVTGCAVAVRRKPADEVAGNVTDRGQGATPLAPLGLQAPAQGDYRLRPDSRLATAGVNNAITALVTQDFYGLPRLPGARSVGATAAAATSDEQSTVLVMGTDGSVSKR